MNIVAAINVGPYYHSRIASAVSHAKSCLQVPIADTVIFFPKNYFQVSQWYVFNDFSINTIMPFEATWFNLSWKIPCVFFYAAEDQVTNNNSVLLVKYF